MFSSVCRLSCLSLLRLINQGDSFIFTVPHGKFPFGKPTRKLEDNIDIGLGEVYCEDSIWMTLAQDSILSRFDIKSVKPLCS